MKLTTLNDHNDVVEVITDDEIVMTTLLKHLWIKTFKVTKDIKRIDYKYNYSGKQKIKVTFSNGYKCLYEDIPTTHCVIDIDTILKGGE